MSSHSQYNAAHCGFGNAGPCCHIHAPGGTAWLGLDAGRLSAQWAHGNGNNQVSPCLWVICQADWARSRAGRSLAVPRESCAQAYSTWQRGLQRNQCWSLQEGNVPLAASQEPGCHRYGPLREQGTAPGAREDAGGKEGRGFEGRKGEISLVHSCTAHSLFFELLTPLQLHGSGGRGAGPQSIPRPGLGLAEKSFRVLPASATRVPRGCGRVTTASLLTCPSAVPNLQSSVGTVIDVQHLDGDES